MSSSAQTSCRNSQGPQGFPSCGFIKKGICCSWLIPALEDKGEKQQRHFCVLSVMTSTKTAGRDSFPKQWQIHTLTCTRQIPSAGRKTTAHPHSPTGCTSDLRHGKSFSHSKEIFSLFLTFLCTDLSSLSMWECCRGGQGLGMQLGPEYSAQVSQQVKAQMQGGVQVRGNTGTPCPATMGCGTGWLESFKLLFFLPKDERRGGQLLEQRCDLL